MKKAKDALETFEICNGEEWLDSACFDIQQAFAGNKSIITDFQEITMKKLLLTISLLLGVLSTSVTAKAAETLDYTQDANFVSRAGECYWATVNATYNYSLAYEFVDAVNDYREANGLDRLPTNLQG